MSKQSSPRQPPEESIPQEDDSTIPFFVSRDVNELLAETAKEIAGLGPLSPSIDPGNADYQDWLFAAVLTAFAHVAEKRRIDLGRLQHINLNRFEESTGPSEKTRDIVDYYLSPEFTVRLTQHMHAAKRKALSGGDE